MHTAYVFTKEAVPLLCRNLSKKCNLTGRQHQGGIPAEAVQQEVSILYIQTQWQDPSFTVKQLSSGKKILLYVYLLLPAQLCC